MRGIREESDNTIPMNRSSDSRHPGACNLDLFVSGGGAKNKALMKFVTCSH